MSDTMTYTYLGDGTKAAARVGAADAGRAGKRYRGSYVYDVTAAGVQSLESVAVSTGRLVALTGTNGSLSFEHDGFATDPLAHKYFSLSPYNYCGNDPVNFFDPDGQDRYTINSDGVVELFQETNTGYDEVYSKWGEGPLYRNAAHVKIYDKSILPSMAAGNNPTGNCSRKDMINLFKFAANTFDGQEWGLYYNKESYELTTRGKASEVGTSLDGVTWKVHSHPNVDTSSNAEIESMGYEPWGSGWYPFSGDAAISKSLHDNSPGYNQTSLVYMVNSKRVYEINVTPGPGPRNVTRIER